MKATVIMIMALNLQESFPTSGLDSTTILHLQRLVLLNNQSRDTYLVVANLTTDGRLVEIAQQAAFERQTQAATLQNILWCNGTSARSQSRGETDTDRRIFKVLDESPHLLFATLIDELLRVDEQVHECYESVRNSIQGRGIRQLLTEQAMRVQRRRKSVLDLHREIVQTNSLQQKSLQEEHRS